MKYKFKSKCKSNNKILGKIVFLSIVLIVMITFFLVSKFNKSLNINLLNISAAEVNRITYSFITNKITNEVINTTSIKDILIINKNNQGEILYVSFDLDKAYKVLDEVSNILTNSFKELENGSIDVLYLDEDLTHKTEGLILNIPLGNSLNSTYFFNLGPKIPVKINYIGSVLTNLETKVTNYGLNNALVEVFVYIELTNQIITPFNVKEIKLEYDAVIASMMIEGEVPSFYNGVIESKSNVYSKDIDSE